LEIHRVLRHARHARSQHRDHRPVLRRSHPQSLTCTIAETGTKEAYSRDPRGIAQRGEKYLISTGLADSAVFGPEAEFFIFDNVQYDCRSNGSFYSVDSAEAVWNTGRDEAQPRLQNPPQGRLFPVAPQDTQQDIRTEMVLEMEKAGIQVERQHHEVATAGQAEIDFRFDTLVKTGRHHDALQVHHQERRPPHGKTVTFMPKPLYGDNGSGMHTHMSLWKKGKPLFAGNEYAGLSKMALHYIGGILKHAKALCASATPPPIPTNASFPATKPLSTSPIQRPEPLRGHPHPHLQRKPKAKRIEYRPPDPSANPYLAYTALLMAGLDGILNKIDPGEPMDKNLYELPPEELARVPQVPGSLVDAIDCLEKDHEFLLKGDVFTRDFHRNVDQHQTQGSRWQPHPYELLRRVEPPDLAPPR
jgi:glutamine synthetase